MIARRGQFARMVLALVGIAAALGSDAHVEIIEAKKRNKRRNKNKSKNPY